MKTIWIVEDNSRILAHMAMLIHDQGYAVVQLPSAEALQHRIHQLKPPDLLLLDIRLPGKSGLDLIQELGRDRLPPTIVISGEATISEALEAMRFGVHDFIEKPFSDDRLLYAIRNCLEKMDLQNKVNHLEDRLAEGQVMLGEDPAILGLLTKIRKVAPTNSRVLITGESGTGKELVAATLHRLSKRNGKPFVKINCAALPAHLIEDELFGHVKGAFTDAVRDKSGLFEQAHGGTLFLDEIGDMELTLQARLLRVLEDGRVRRIGDKLERQVDVRIISATHRNLLELSDENGFREDLYYRLAGLPLHVPPLRDRKQDIPLLTTFFIRKFCRQHQTGLKEISADLFDHLSAYNWPGNIRELKNLAERLVIFGGNPLSSNDLPSDFLSGKGTAAHGLLRIAEIPTLPWKTFKTQVEKEYLEAMLQRVNWNFTEVASQLKINRSHLHQKVAALGIQKERSG